MLLPARVGQLEGIQVGFRVPYWTLPCFKLSIGPLLGGNKSIRRGLSNLYN